MSRNYGSLQGQGRRAGGSAWQWVVIGGILGFMCAAVFIVGALAAGLVYLDPNTLAANNPTQTPFIITATPEPVTPTEPPTLAPTETPTEEAPLIVQPPTASPTLQPTFLTLAAPPTAEPTVPIEQAGLQGQNQGSNVGGDVAPRNISQNLLAVASEMRLVQGGQFQMGTTIAEVVAAVDQCVAGYGGAAGACQPTYGDDAQPQHTVTVSSFNIEVYEVSYSQYVAFLNEMGPRSHMNGCFGQPCVRTNIEAAEVAEILFDSANYSVVPTLLNFPVTNVTWYGARAYCEALGRRLPTEAEWERTARGDDGRIFPWGNEWNPSYASTSRSTNPQRVPVTEYLNTPSVYGAVNLSGNVAEWVNDWYSQTYYGTTDALSIDPQGPPTGSQKSVRGGAWSSVPFFARTMHRQSAEANNPQPWIGFRCAGDINPTGTAQQQGGVTTASLPQTVATNTPDPSTLGISIPNAGSNEEGLNSQPTLPPAQPVLGGQPTQISGTLAPG